MSATPRPWVIGVSRDSYDWPVFRLRDMASTDSAEVEAIRQEIEAAVNNYETLVEALKAVDSRANDWGGAARLEAQAIVNDALRLAGAL